MASLDGLIAIVLLTVLTSFTSTSCEESSFTPSSIEYLTPNDVIHRAHRRDKRSPVSSDSSSSQPEADREVKFEALGRKFHMLLHEREDIIAPNFKVSLIGKGGKAQVFHHDLLNKFYHGHLAGHREAKVVANINPNNQVINGYIDDKENDLMYYIEPAKNVANKTQDDLPDDMMAVYTYDKDKQLSNLPKKFCDSINLKDDAQFMSDLNITNSRSPRSTSDDSTSGPDSSPSAQNLVFKRPNRCGMRIVADTSFYKNMNSKIRDTVNYVVSVMDRINSIYISTNFGDSPDSDLQGFGFVIQEIQVHAEYDEKPDHYNSKNSSDTINKLLDKFSQDTTHKWFCLSHLFTHTRFQEGVLGLAYVANPRRAVPGGICSGKVFRNGKEYFYNTGVTSTKNSYGKSIFTRITDLITAHELGHNWGAEHDPDLKECSPSSRQGGPYLMHTYSLNGNEANNKLFSPCSKRSIASVLSFRSPVCFLPDSKNICGNGVIDENEECDPGHISKAQTPDTGGGDECCSLECKLKPGAVCSDFNHLCCDRCKIRQRGDLCREANQDTCKDATFCDGSSRDCPTVSRHVVNGLPCLDGGTCTDGKCLDICEQNKKVPCICHQREEDYCSRCCRESDANSTCTPFGRGYTLSDGSPCIYGFCEKGKCKRAPQDLVKRLWEIISTSSLNSFLRLMLDNLVFVTVLGVAIVYVPFSWWINSKDNEIKAKLADVSTHMYRSRAQPIDSSGDNWEMVRLNDDDYSPPGHRYNLRSSRNRTDVPDEVDNMHSPSYQSKGDLTVDLPDKLEATD